jgi:pimeloyl-ACP methyl ester carboxylesterase
MHMKWLIAPLIFPLAFLFSPSKTEAQELFTVKKSGKGAPMILIHGMACTGEVWEETVAYYNSRFECHVVTLAGFGNTPPKLRPDFLRHVKDELIAYTHKEKLRKPILMGHSMGGYLALWAAASAPGTFEAVVAVDGVPYFPVLQMPYASKEEIAAMAGQMRDMMANQTPEQVRASQPMFLSAMLASKAHYEKISRMGVESHAPTIAAAMYEMYTTDLREEVATIQCPVLVMGSWIGYKDFGATEAATRQAYLQQLKLIKGAEFAMAQKAKHFIFYDDPEWFQATVDEFLGNLGRKAKP